MKKGPEPKFRPIRLRSQEERLAAGRAIDGIASVASFFVSRVDTEVEIEYLKNGGVLHYVLRNLAKS